jgi:hypothetical protein
LGRFYQKEEPVAVINEAMKQVFKVLKIAWRWELRLEGVGKKNDAIKSVLRVLIKLFEDKNRGLRDLELWNDNPRPERLGQILKQQ